MITKPIVPFTNKLPVHTAPPTADLITQLSYRAHKNPLNTLQQQAPKDA